MSCTTVFDLLLAQSNNKAELVHHERDGTIQHLRQILPIVLSMSNRDRVRDGENEGDVCMYRSAEDICATSATRDLDAKVRR